MTSSTTSRSSESALVSVVIVSWNSSEETLRCIGSVFEHTSIPTEVVVIDNDSDDDTVSRTVAAFPQVRVIGTRENVGFARACNQGMDAARGDFLLLTNSDTLVCDDVIGRSAAWLETLPDVGRVGCDVRNFDSRRIRTAHRALGVRQSLLENLWLYKLIPPERRPFVLLNGCWEGNEEVDADWLGGVYLFLRRRVYEVSHGFDPRFFMYGEDSEWGMRLRRLGVRIVCAPSICVVWHVGAKSSEGVWDERERLRRGHDGGLRAYTMLHVRFRALLYRLSLLVGVTPRLLSYSVLMRVRPSDYVATQRRLYGWFRDFTRDRFRGRLAGLYRSASASTP